MHGRSTTLLEMDFPIVDFLTLYVQEPYAVLVLLEKDLVLIDLGQIGYPIFETPYPLTLHESPVTCCEYFVDCPSELIPALYSVGSRQKRQCFSKKEWPISGGNWGQGTQSYPEIIITGHADGSIKFWDASALMLQMLYKLKTAKVFERSRRSEEKGGSEMVDEDPFAIQTLSWCPESRMLCVAGVSAHIIIYRFSKQEVTTDTLQLLEVRMQSEFSEGDSPESPEQRLPPPSSPQEADAPPQTPNCFQVELVVQLLWVSGDPPQPITSLAVNSSYGLVVFGNSSGLAVVDFLQKTLLLNMGISDLCNPADPHLRQPRSPRKTRHTSTVSEFDKDDPSETSCMSRLSNLYSESVKKLRSSHITAGDSVDGSNTSEDRCKSPTSGSASPCNSDDERKHRFIEKVKSKSRRFSKTVANDFEVNASFSRSRSSSVSSLDRESREVISSLSFCESFPRKGDASLGPSLLLGTSMGSVIMVALSLPPPGETRLQQPVGVAPCGSLETLKAGILTMALLDSSVEGQDSQFLVLVSEKQAKVLALPSQSRLHKHSISESSFVLRADVVTLGGGNCIACFCANGHIMTL
ncbi:Syntaxin-binding protein 5, partial [Dissostichus eleginoides]